MVVSEGLRWCTRHTSKDRNCWIEWAVLADRENSSDSIPFESGIMEHPGTSGCNMQTNQPWQSTIWTWVTASSFETLVSWS